MTGLVPEPNPSQQTLGGVREGVGRGQSVRARGRVRGGKLFLPYGGRPSSAMRPGPRALCEVGLAAWFLF